MKELVFCRTRGQEHEHLRRLLQFIGIAIACGRHACGYAAFTAAHAGDDGNDRRLERGIAIDAGFYGLNGFYGW